MQIGKPGNHTAKKRKRSTTATNDVPTAVPTIDHVSANVTPLLLQAVKSQKKLIVLQHRHRLEQEQTQRENGNEIYHLRNNNPSAMSNNTLTVGTDTARRADTYNSNKVQEDILQRIDSIQQQQQRMQNSKTNSGQALADQRQEAMNCCQTLLNAIDKESTDIRSSEVPIRILQLESIGAGGAQQYSKITNCATGCVDFLLDLLSDRACKIVLRHAALWIIRSLVMHRNDCRVAFSSAGTVKNFVDFVSDADDHLRMDALGRLNGVVNSNANVHNRGRDNTGNDTNLGTSGNSANDKISKIGSRGHVTMYQRDALTFLHDFSNLFDPVQPHLIIAARYLEEQKGVSISTTTNSHNGQHGQNYHVERNTNGNMIELRKLRDRALKLAEKEVRRVNKVLGVMDSCFEILVPRFGHQFHSSSSFGVETSTLTHCSKEESEVNVGLSTCTTRKNDKDKDAGASTSRNIINKKVECEDVDDDNNDNDDDDDIDWEDGDESTLVEDPQKAPQAEADNKKQDPLNQNPEVHDGEDRLAAVERTLAVMKQSGALKNDGTLEVDLCDNQVPKAHASDGFDDTPAIGHERSIQEKEAREKLSKCVEFLSKKHAKISVWIDALMSADNMTEVNNIQPSSLSASVLTVSNNRKKQSISSVILLPENLRKKKGPMTRMLIDIRNNIFAALSAEATMKRTQIDSTVSRARAMDLAYKVHDQDVKAQGSEKDFQESNDAQVAMQPWQEALGVKRIGSLPTNASFQKKGGRKKFKKGRLKVKLRKL